MNRQYFYFSNNRLLASLMPARRRFGRLDRPSGSLDGWNQWEMPIGGSRMASAADSGLGQLVTNRAFRFSDPVGILDRRWGQQWGIHSHRIPTISPTRMLTSEYFDTPDQTYRTGSIVNIAPPSEIINTPNKWNNFDIVADGTKLKVILNGITLSIPKTINERGPFTLQYGEGVVKSATSEFASFKAPSEAII